MSRMMSCGLEAAHKPHLWAAGYVVRGTGVTEPTPWLYCAGAHTAELTPEPKRPDAPAMRDVLRALIEQVTLDKTAPYWAAKWGDSGDPDAITAWLSSLLDADWQPPPAGLAELADALTSAFNADGHVTATRLFHRITTAGWTPPARGGA